MKKLIFLLLVSVFACKEDDNGPKTYTSIEGKWRYTTPDEDMRVEFEIHTINGEYKIKKGTIFVENQKLAVKIEDDNIDISEPDGSIISIGLSAEGYVGIAILFQSISRNEFYTELFASDVDYYPNPGELKRIRFQTITR